MAIIKYAPFNGFESFPALKAFEDTMNRLFVEPMAGRGFLRLTSGKPRTNW